MLLSVDFNKKKINFVFLLIFIFSNLIIISHFKINDINIKLENKNNKLIKENFFVFDSNNLENIQSHMYGFSVSKKGIITDNYYKQIGYYFLPEPLGAFVIIRKLENEIIINQDFYGSYGIYIYQNKESNYFALSNSFLLLQEYLIDKANINLNKDYANSFIISVLCSYSLEETLIKEISQIPGNAYIVINKDIKTLKINYIDYKENTISLESEEGIKIIDKWVDKWGYILRSIIKQTDNISIDLSGGFDTRILFTIILNSGVDLNDINIFSIQDKVHDHDVDFEIAKNISIKYGFKLNNHKLKKEGTNWNLKDTLYNSLYSKLGFHKELYFNNKFFANPLFIFAGSNGETLRGTPNSPIDDFIKYSSYNDVPRYKLEFYNSSIKIMKKSVSYLTNQKSFNNDYEIASSLYDKAMGRNHFGKFVVERFSANIFTFQPLMDPFIRQIKFNINKNSYHDLVAYIFVRYAPGLINIPFQGKRKVDLMSIKKAESLNNISKPYIIKSDYNKNFYIDQTRKFPSVSSKNEINIYTYLTELFQSYKFIQSLNKMYDDCVYLWANKYSKASNYFPFRHYYALLAIVVTLENLSLNERFMKNKTKISSTKIFENLK